MTVNGASQASEPEFAYRHVRGRSPTRQASPPRERSRSWQQSLTQRRSLPPYRRIADGNAGNEHSAYRRALGESNDHPESSNRHNFGGRVRYVKPQYVD